MNEACLKLTSRSLQRLVLLPLLVMSAAALFSPFATANEQREKRLALSALEPEQAEVINAAASLLRQGKASAAYALVEPLLTQPAPPPEVLAMGALSLTRDNRGPRALRLAELLTATPGYRMAGLAVLYDVQSKTFSTTLAINAVSTRVGDADSATWTQLGEIYAEILTDFAAKSASEVIDNALPLFQHAAAVAMQEDPEAIVRTHLRLADLQAARQDAAAVIESLRRALDAQPENRDALVRLAIAMIEQGDLKGAATELEKIVAKHPDYLPALTALIELYVNLEQPARAIALIEKCLERADFDSELALAELAARINAWHLVYQLALRAQEREPDSIRPHVFLVESSLREKRYDDALRHASEAYAQFPNSPLVVQMAVVAAREARNLDLATVYLDRLERITTEESEGIRPIDVIAERAILAERRNNIPEMERHFRRVLELDPNNHFAMNYMAYTFADRGIRLDEALDLITRAITFEPENSAYLDTLGWVHYMRGEFAKAYEFISKAAEIGPPHEEIFENLGDVADALGRHEEAIRHWQRSLELQPDRPFVAEKIAAVQRGERLQHPLPYVPPPGTPLPILSEQQQNNEHTTTTTATAHQSSPKDPNQHQPITGDVSNDTPQVPEPSPREPSPNKTPLPDNPPAENPASEEDDDSSDESSTPSDYPQIIRAA